jgi:hypothetical protein
MQGIWLFLREQLDVGILCLCLGCSSASPRSPRLREMAVGCSSVSPCLREIIGCWLILWFRLRWTVTLKIDFFLPLGVFSGGQIDEFFC